MPYVSVSGSVLDDSVLGQVAPTAPAPQSDWTQWALPVLGLAVLGGAVYFSLGEGKVRKNPSRRRRRPRRISRG